MKILVIGDCHIHKGDNLRRFKAMKIVLQKYLPERIVIIGDFCIHGSS